MKATELGEFVGRVRRLFGGPMDEELFAIAKERIGGLAAKPCAEALDEYALAHGGPRSRFIPAKFLEIYSRRTERLDAEAERTARLAAKRRAEIGVGLEAEQHRREWDSIRRDVAALDDDRRRAAVDVMRRAGWHYGGSEPSGWSDTQVLAVRDLATGATVMVRDQESGEWNVPVAALEFWTRLVPRPSQSPLGASLLEERRRPTPSTERLGEPLQAVSVDRAAVASAVFGMDDEIPF
jgi:hypothetical protein